MMKRSIAIALLIAFIAFPARADDDVSPNNLFLVTKYDPWLPNLPNPAYVKAPYHVVTSLHDGGWSNGGNWDGALDEWAVVHVRHQIVFDAGQAKVAAIGVF